MWGECWVMLGRMWRSPRSTLYKQPASSLYIPQITLCPANSPLHILHRWSYSFSYLFDALARSQSERIRKPWVAHCFVTSCSKSCSVSFEDAKHDVPGANFACFSQTKEMLHVVRAKGHRKSWSLLGLWHLFSCYMLHR